MHNDQQLADLEKLLVQEFRSLQHLSALTREERETMPGKNLEALNRLIEQKEQVLDQLNLMLDSRRMLIEQISNTLCVPNENSSLQELLPFISRDDQERFSRLSVGIDGLVTEIRDMNYGNIALANMLINIVQSVQETMLRSLQKQIDYRPAACSVPTSQVGANSFDQCI